VAAPSATPTPTPTSVPPDSPFSFAGTKTVKDAEGYTWSISWDIGATDTDVVSNTADSKPGFTSLDLTLNPGKFTVTNTTDGHNLQRLGGGNILAWAVYPLSSKACAVSGVVPAQVGVTLPGKAGCALYIGAGVLTALTTSGLQPGETDGSDSLLTTTGHMNLSPIKESDFAATAASLLKPSNIFITLSTGSGDMVRGFDTKLSKLCMMNSGHEKVVLASKKPFACA
jgi:hypothetical protein